ncbi:protein Rf1, mitochondrial-like [Panicum miliaceum]|uniref:Protein Rf1, mitochondrial-like n=1 Tax=Panicum miliaceum TaxID=4540 RepID=A0A3L6PJU9_PANMI|nr:protein Rf1, mitochondrial-like [Panicum miliaceum]
MQGRPSVASPGRYPCRAPPACPAACATDAWSWSAPSLAASLDDAVKMFDELLPHARPASVRAFNHLLTSISRAQGRDSSTSALVVSLFNRMARASPNKVAHNGSTYNILIGCFCRMGRLELGFASFGLVLKAGWRVETVINPLLKGLCDTKRVDEAMDILPRRMPEFGCPPNTVAYTIVIDGLFGDGQVDKAYNLFREMDNRRIFPTVVAYTAVIDGLCKAQAVDRAEGVLQQMIHKGVKPNNQTYTCLIHGYCSSGQGKKVVRMLKEMSAHGHGPNVVTCNLLLDYHCKNGRCTEARKIFDSMIEKGTKPNVTTYSTLLNGYATYNA